MGKCMAQNHAVHIIGVSRLPSCPLQLLSFHTCVPEQFTDLAPKISSAVFVAELPQMVHGQWTISIISAVSMKAVLTGELGHL